MVKFTEAMSLGMKISGKTAEESEGAIKQLMIAFQSGKFTSRGFRPLLADLPSVAQAGANNLKGANGSVPQMMQMIQSGQVSPRAFFDAVIKGIDGLKDLASRNIDPVSEAMTRLDNAMEKYVGHVSDLVGASRSLASGIDFLAEHIDDVAKAALVLAGALGPVGIVAAARGAVVAFDALSIAIAANPLGAALIVVGAITAALIVYAPKVASVAEAVRDEKKAHEELNKVLDDAVKNHNQASKDKIDEAKDHLLAAQAKLKEAQAQAVLNYNNAVAHDNATRYGGANTEYGPVGPFAPAMNVSDAKKDLADIRVAQKQNVDDLMKLGRVKVTPETNNPPQTVDDGKAATLAQRRAETLARLNAAAIEAHGKMVSALADAHEKMLKGSDDYYASVIASSDAETTAQLADIDAKRDEELAALEKMKKGWAGYAVARAAINQQAWSKKNEVFAKQSGEIGAPIGEIAEQTKALIEQTAMLGMTTTAAERYATEQKFTAIAAALSANGHVLLAMDLMAAVEGYDKASKAAEDHAKSMQVAVAEADTLRQGLEDIGAAGMHGFKGMKDAAAQMLQQFAEMIIRLEVMQPLVEGLFGEKGTPFSLGAKGGGGGGLLSNISGGIRSALGFASGGAVRGPGSSRDDSIIARLSNGEYVVNAIAAGKNRALLDMINSGHIHRFAMGGLAALPSTGEHGPELVSRPRRQ